MGKLHYFLGVKIAYPGSRKIWIGQLAYTAEDSKRFQMENSKPTATPIDTGAKLTKATEDSKLFNQSIISFNKNKTRYCLCLCSYILFQAYYGTLEVH